MEIKSGSVLKFETKSRTEQGVVLNIDKESNKITIMNMIGHKWNLYKDSIIKVSSVRLNPEVRALFKDIYKREQSLEAYDKLIKDTLKMQQQFRTDIFKDIKKIQEVTGILSWESFGNELVEVVSDKIGHCSGVYVHLDTYPTNTVCYNQNSTIQVAVSYDIEKYPRPEEYPYLYTEYDMTLHIHSGSESYKKDIGRYSKKFTKDIILKKIADKCYESLDLGDKYLYFTRVYTFDIKECTQKQLNEIIKSIKEL